MPDLQQGTLTLGEWQVTCRCTDNEGATFQYSKVGPLAEDTELEEARQTLRTMDNTDIIEKYIGHEFQQMDDYGTVCEPPFYL